MTEKMQTLQRLHDLENSIAEIRAEMDTPGKWRRFGRLLSQAPKFVVTNLCFLAYVITAIVAWWAYRHYDISYFETQKNMSAMKQSAEFYRQLGDRLLLINEREAAEDAYSAALKINPADLEASRGLFKSQILEPLAGRKYGSPEVDDQKIASLEKFITDGRDRYIIPYLKGERYEEREEYKLAKDSYEESTKLNPEFVYGYLAVAYASILNSEGVDLAKDNWELALKHDPNSALALSGLGYYSLMKLDFDEAIIRLDNARKISTYVETLVHLGNAKRFKGDDDNLAEAVYYHKIALGLLEDNNENENAVAGEMAINFMPERPDDDKTPKDYVTFGTVKEKTALVYYELSLDYAMEHDWLKADKAFARALQLDEDRAYETFVDNKMQSIACLAQVKPDLPTINWFKRATGWTQATCKSKG